MLLLKIMLIYDEPLSSGHLLPVPQGLPLNGRTTVKRFS